MSDTFERRNELKNSRDFVFSNDVEIRQRASQLQGEAVVAHMKFLGRKISDAGKWFSRTAIRFYDSVPNMGGYFADYGGKL